MDSKIKRIYMYMADIKHWPWRASAKKVSQHLETMGIRTTEVWDELKGKITGGQWYRSMDGQRQNWLEGYAEKIKDVSERIQAIKGNIIITDEIRAAAEVLALTFENRWEGYNIVPFRDRKHTRGVFRRVK